MQPERSIYECVPYPLNGSTQPALTQTVKRPYMRHPPCAVECRCDGNKVYALIGPDYVTGVAGFGDTLADALRDLADQIEMEVTVVNSPTDSAQE